MIEQYFEKLWLANTQLNLFSRKTTRDELFENHFVDCCLALRYFPHHVHSVADFGSGGGLPGVLYALQFPSLKFHLYEKSPKKRVFLESCRELAPNLVIRSEINEQTLNCDLIVARAFKPLEVILEMSRSYFEASGRYFLLKGRLETIEEEVRLAKNLLLHSSRQFEPTIIELQPPKLDVERHLVLIGG